MSIVEMAIGRKYYQIDCNEEVATSLQEVAERLNVLINTKAVELGMRVENDYLLLLVCLDLLSDKSVDRTIESTQDAAPVVADSVAVSPAVSEDKEEHVVITREQQKIIKNLLKVLAK